MQTTDTIEGVVLTYYIGFEFGSERILNDIVPWAAMIPEIPSPTIPRLLPVPSLATKIP